MKREESVQNRQLKNWVSEDEYVQIEAEWHEQIELREELKDKPNEFKRYEDKLKEANIMRNHSDAYHRKGKNSAAYKLDRKRKILSEDVLDTIWGISIELLSSTDTPKCKRW